MLIGFIISNWRYVALVLVVLAALGALWQFGRVQYQKGYDTAMSEVAMAKMVADDKTRSKQKTIRKKSQERKAKINDQNDDRPVGPLLQRYFDGLRSGS